MADLSTAEYRELVRAALAEATEADTAVPRVGTLFTPDSHRLALSPDVTIVRGARGTGKTYWSKALENDELRELASDVYQIGALRKVTVLRGFGNKRRPDNYPSHAVLRQLVDERADPTNVWTAVLLAALGHGSFRQMPSWKDRTAWVAANPEALESALHQADSEAAADGRTILLVFDALDRLHGTRSEADRLVGGILRLALDLRLSSNRLRAKVFIRPDMLNTAPMNFADSSKLIANPSDLTWSTENLFGLAFHQLGNGPGPLSERFRRQHGPWARQSDGRRYAAPRDVTGDRDRQQEIFTEIAGPYMGTNHRRGRTYSWLPNHLMDGAEQVSPRSFLTALRTAAENTATTRSGHGYALHYDGIRRGVQDASTIRKVEVVEDIPWVRTAIEPLAGIQVPADESTVLDRWAEAAVLDQIDADGRTASGADPDEIETGPEATTERDLIDELIGLGIMTRRRDGRVDLPDVYRIAFDIGRKGGVPRIR